MSAKLLNEDLFYQQQTLELNTLGNSLLSGVIGEKLQENKRKIANKVHIAGDLHTYKSEIDKLKSLKIANIHKILKINEESSPTVQILAAEKLLVKIEEILDAHIKYSAKDVVSKNELEQLKNHMNVLQSLKENFRDVPNTTGSKLKNIEEFSTDLKKIIEYIEAKSAKLNESQMSIVKDASEVLNFSLI